MTSHATSAATPRAAHVTRALRLEYVTVAWNVVEAVIALSAAWLAGSVALLGFGADSVVESASGLVLVWRLRQERAGGNAARVAHVEHRARKLVAASLALLAAYVAFESVSALALRERPDPSLVGIALAVASVIVMFWLFRAKRRVGGHLGSRALLADAFQTEACFWLSLILLAGVGLNAAFGWWWADPLAALAMVWPILSEAREAWDGDEA